MEKIPNPLSLVCLAGPTGAGKTALALRIAEECGCEVVNADSRQVYTDFPLITAQPSQEERAVCPHHLYGYLPTEDNEDVQSWLQKVLTLGEEIRARGKIPLLVGGTGFYFQIALHGIAAIPQVPTEVHSFFLHELETRGILALHQELSQKDPLSAARIHPNDKQRILRALEVEQATGKALSLWHKEATTPASCSGPLFVANTSLHDLEPRLLRRIDLMLEAGALDEAKKALERCPQEDAPGWSGIGCREVRSYLEKKISFQEMRDLWYKNTRAYAKRQITWFKGRKEAIWIDVTDEEGFLGKYKDRF